MIEETTGSDTINIILKGAKLDEDFLYKDENTNGLSTTIATNESQSPLKPTN